MQTDHLDIKYATGLYEEMKTFIKAFVEFKGEYLVVEAEWYGETSVYDPTIQDKKLKEVYRNYRNVLRITDIAGVMCAHSEPSEVWSVQIYVKGVEDIALSVETEQEARILEQFLIEHIYPDLCLKPLSIRQK